MTEADITVDRAESAASGVVVLHPQPGHSPVGHLVIDLDLSGGTESVAGCTRVTCSLHGRLDVAEAERSGSGRWHLDVPAVLLESEFRITVRAHAGADVHDVAVVTGRNDRFRPRHDGMQALLMHQLGRAGSTMMMRLLAGHPAVAVFDDYPLETRPGLAWMHTLASLLGTQTIPPGDEPFFDEVPTTTANPYLSEYFLGADIFAAQQREGFDRVRSVIGDIVEDLYLQLRPGAMFFAEKFRIESARAAETQATTLATWPGTRQIVLVRDPRDLLCSRLSFNQQRSAASFDLDLTDDAITGAPTIVQHLRLAARQVEAFPDAILVRYEDLVERPVATATRVFRDLELDHSFETVQRAVSVAVSSRSDRHVTTASAAASIGRWRDELPSGAASHLVTELADELTLFGYDR